MTEKDQARKLRELVLQVRGQRNFGCCDPERRSPAIVATFGCCAGVGTSTITDQLAAVLAAGSNHVEAKSKEALLDDAQVAGDIVLIDSGAGCSQEFASRWNHTDIVLFVVTSAREALLETYKALKIAKLENPDLPIYLLPNRCLDEREAQMIHERITESCERFLGFSVPTAPWLPQLTNFEKKSILHPSILKLAQFVQQHALLRAKLRTEAA